jgi:hypothetical protein
VRFPLIVLDSCSHVESSLFDAHSLLFPWMRRGIGRGGGGNLQEWEMFGKMEIIH